MLILPLVCQLQRMSRLFFCKSIFCPFTDRNTRRGQRYQGRRALPPSSTICGIRSGHTTTESSREEFSLLVHSFERAPVDERWVWLFVPCYLTQVRELTALSKTFSKICKFEIQVPGRPMGMKHVEEVCRFIRGWWCGGCHLQANHENG